MSLAPSSSGISLPGLDLRTARPQVAVDGSNLENLKRLARDNPQQAVRAAAQQFEAVFLQMVLKSMRATEMKSGLLESSSGDMFSNMYDEQLTKTLSQRGVGLADMLEKQLLKASNRKDPGITDTPIVQPLLQPQQSTLGKRAVTPEHAISTLEKLTRATLQAQQITVEAQNTTLDASTTPRDFVQKLWSHAKAAEQQSGIPAQYMLGQAALESGWGTREIKTADGQSAYNLFGIKAGSNWSGKVAESTTTEYVNGVPKKTVERFRAYTSYAEAFQDYARLISQNPRYQQALQNTADPQAYAAQLQKAGYATDPNYANKLGKTIAATLKVMA